jgi:hypothetical protein
MSLSVYDWGTNVEAVEAVFAAHPDGVCCVRDIERCGGAHRQQQGQRG